MTTSAAEDLGSTSYTLSTWRNGGPERWPGMVAWNGGLEWWPGTVNSVTGQDPTKLDPVHCDDDGTVARLDLVPLNTAGTLARNGDHLGC